MYLGRTSEDLRPNDSEIAALRYVTPGRLEREFVARPERFTPWFRQEWQELKTRYRAQLARYCETG
mgnify:FL=1